MLRAGQLQRWASDFFIGAYNMTPDEYKLLIPELSPKWKKDNQKESDTRADRALTFI
jgi:hypothetical protein